MKIEDLSPETQEQIKEAFSPELLERAKAVKSMEDLLDIAEEEGVELSDEQLELVAGGCYDQLPRCNPICSPNC